MKTELLQIDVTLDADSSCNNNRINDCCLAATLIGAAALGESAKDVTSASLKLNCPGYDHELGCQAHITGALLDANGLPVSAVATTAHELQTNPIR